MWNKMYYLDNRMLSIKCPKCQGKVTRKIKKIPWCSNIWICKNCGVMLKCTNKIVLGGLSGLIAGSLIISSHYWSFGTMWLRYIIVVLICWSLWPLIVRLLGCWHIVTKTVKFNDYPTNIKRLVYLNRVSFGLLILCFLGVKFIWWHITKKIQSLDNHDSSLQMFSESISSLTSISYFIVLSSLVFLLVCFYCSVRINRFKREFETT